MRGREDIFSSVIIDRQLKNNSIKVFGYELGMRVPFTYLESYVIIFASTLLSLFMELGEKSMFIFHVAEARAFGLSASKVKTVRANKIDKINNNETMCNEVRKSCQGQDNGFFATFSHLHNFQFIHQQSRLDGDCCCVYRNLRLIIQIEVELFCQNNNQFFRISMNMQR